MDVFPSCFSHTTIDSGCSDSASTRMSECVVTINWQRVEASTSRSANLGKRSGCRPSSGSSMHISGGGFGIAKNRQQAQVTETAVGKPRRRNREIAFREEDLHRAAFDADVEIGQDLRRDPGDASRCLFGLRLPPQPVEEQAEIREILFQTVGSQIGPLRFADRGIPPDLPLAIDAYSVIRILQARYFRIVLRIVALRENRKIGLNRSGLIGTVRTSRAIAFGHRR